MLQMAGLRAMARLAAVLLLGSSPVTALTIEYCSDANTASSSTLESSIYQSNGLCEEQCQSDYAFAVLQGDDCWCSDYVPESQVDVSECDSSCPGYPSDTCGNSDKGLFGYIAMSNVQPSGTEAGTTDTASATGSATTSTSSSTSEGTATQTPTPLVETVTVTESKTTRTTFATSVLDSSSSTTDPPSTTTSATIAYSTVGGQRVTITVSDTSATSTSTSGSSSGKSASLSGGAIAGIVIGSLAGVGAIAAFALWYFFFGRKRNDDRSEKSGSPTGNDGSVAGGTIDTRRQSRGSQMSFMRNFMSPTDNETTATSPTDYLSPSQAFTDNRMKKNANLYPNGDRQSAVSLRDDEDYSRPVLRLTNPD